MGNRVIGEAVPHPEWRLIVKHLQESPYGVLVTHDDLEAVTGLRVGDRNYHRQVSRARETLLEYQRELETVPGCGYRLVQPDEFHGRARREGRLAGRRVRRAQRVLVAAPQELLSDDQNRRNADALAKFGALELMRRDVLRDTRPSLPFVRPDVPKLISG